MKQPAPSTNPKLSEGMVNNKLMILNYDTIQRAAKLMNLVLQYSLL